MEEKIKEDIFRQIENYYKTKKRSFIPGKDRITYSEPAYSYEEVNAAVASLFDGWLAEGQKTEEFEKRFADYIGTKDCVVFNSGSSSLLMAFALLKDNGIENPIKDKDEVITSAVLFPTALSAITLNNLTPVLVDVELDTYNINPDLIEEVISNKTRAILVSHNLGNPCDMDRINSIAKKYNLYVIEDCCDSYGADYNGKKVGSIGNLGCFSFHAGHTLATGEGGAITFHNRAYRKKLLSLKACGRDEEEGNLQSYTRLAYKLRIIDLQAAMGLEQLKKSNLLVKKRIENFNYYYTALKKYEKFLRFVRPYSKAKPSWFSVPFTVRQGLRFNRDELVEWLESKNIQTRPILGGNIIRQPALKNIKIKSTELPNADIIHNNSFYIGCHPNLTTEMREYVVKSFDEFFLKSKFHSSETSGI